MDSLEKRLAPRADCERQTFQNIKEADCEALMVYLLSKTATSKASWASCLVPVNGSINFQGSDWEQACCNKYRTNNYWPVSCSCSYTGENDERPCSFLLHNWHTYAPYWRHISKQDIQALAYEVALCEDAAYHIVGSYTSNATWIQAHVPMITVLLWTTLMA